MKICVFGTRGIPNIQGGVEKHCEFLYPFISSKNEVIIFRRKPYITSSVQMKGISYIDLPSTRIQGFEALFHSFLCCLYCIYLRPDIVHIHNIGPAIFTPLLKLFRLKVVLTYHSPNYEHKKWGKFARLILKTGENVSFRYADQIIFVNKMQRQKALYRLKCNSFYIPNGVQPVSSLSLSVSAFSKWDLQPYKYILAVGRITEEKGFDILISAFQQWENPFSYKLVIVGDSPNNTNYCQDLKKKGENQNVIFTGVQQGSALSSLYSQAALFVLSSRNEGFPLVLLEAMSFGRDILASNIVKDIDLPLEPDDLFQTESVDSLIAGLARKLNNEKGLPVRKYDLSSYQWERVASQTLEIFEKCKCKS